MSRELKNPACRRRLTGLTAAPCLAALLLAACGSEPPATPGNGPDPVTVLLTADPVAGVAGTLFTLTWQSTGANGCTASGAWSGVRPVAGAATITPGAGTHEYVLSCSGAGSSAQDAVTIVVTTAQIPALSLTAAPASGDIPLRVNLNWIATHVTACAASGGWSGQRPLSGNESITLDTAGVHDFTLNCDGPSGPLSQQVTVTASDAFGEARSEFERLRTLENRTLF